MSIDWFTVGAQLLNFLILVGLLKHFLYRPILDGIDAREQEIAIRLGEAASIKAEAHAALAEHRQQVDLLQQQKSDTLASCRAAAELERDKILDDARQRIEADIQAAQHQRQCQAQRYIHDLNNQAGRILLAVTQKVVKDLSDETLEERLVMHALTIMQQDAFQHDNKKNTNEEFTHAEVCTKNELSENSQARLQASMSTRWPELTLSFTSSAEQSPGALVKMGSLQVDWTIDTYVSDLEASLTKTLLHAAEHRQ